MASPFTPPLPKSDPTTGAGGTNSSTETGKKKEEPKSTDTTNPFGVKQNPNQSRSNGGSSRNKSRGGSSNQSPAPSEPPIDPLRSIDYNNKFDQGVASQGLRYDNQLNAFIRDTRFSAGSGQLNTVGASPLGATPQAQMLRPETAFESAQRVSAYEQNLYKQGYSDEERAKLVEELKSKSGIIQIDQVTGRAFAITKGGFETVPDTAQLQANTELIKKIESGQITVQDIIPEGRQINFILADESGKVIPSPETVSNLQAIKNVVTQSEKNKSKPAPSTIIPSSSLSNPEVAEKFSPDPLTNVIRVFNEPDSQYGQTAKAVGRGAVVAKDLFLNAPSPLISDDVTNYKLPSEQEIADYRTFVGATGVTAGIGALGVGAGLTGLTTELGLLSAGVGVGQSSASIKKAVENPTRGKIADAIVDVTFTALDVIPVAKSVSAKVNEFVTPRYTIDADAIRQTSERVDLLEVAPLKTQQFSQRDDINILATAEEKRVTSRENIVPVTVDVLGQRKEYIAVIPERTSTFSEASFTVSSDPATGFLSGENPVSGTIRQEFAEPIIVEKNAFISEIEPITYNPSEEGLARERIFASARERKLRAGERVALADSDLLKQTQARESLGLIPEGQPLDVFSEESSSFEPILALPSESRGNLKFRQTGTDTAITSGDILSVSQLPNQAPTLEKQFLTSRVSTFTPEKAELNTETILTVSPSQPRTTGDTLNEGVLITNTDEVLGESSQESFIRGRRKGDLPETTVETTIETPTRDILTKDVFTEGQFSEKVLDVNTPESSFSFSQGRPVTQSQERQGLFEVAIKDVGSSESRQKLGSIPEVKPNEDIIQRSASYEYEKPVESKVIQSYDETIAQTSKRRVPDIELIDIKVGQERRATEARIENNRLLFNALDEGRQKAQKTVAKMLTSETDLIIEGELARQRENNFLRGQQKSIKEDFEFIDVSQPRTNPVNVIAKSDSSIQASGFDRVSARPAYSNFDITSPSGTVSREDIFSGRIGNTAESIGEQQQKATEQIANRLFKVPRLESPSSKSGVNVLLDFETIPAKSTKSKAFLSTLREGVLTQNTARTLQDTALKTQSLLKTESLLKTDSLLKQDTLLKEDTILKTDYLLKQDTALKTDTLLKQDSLLKTESVLKQGTLLKQENIKANRFKNNNFKTPTELLPPFAIDDEGRKNLQGYNVLVREKGKLIKVNKNAQTENNALNLLGDYIDNTPAKSGKIVPTKNKPQSPESNYIFDSSKYREKKGFKIEKNKYAIDTRGEREGITVKGLKARRDKSTLNKILGKSKSKTKRFTF